MNMQLSRLKTRLRMIECQIRGYDQMIQDAKFWGARVSLAHESRAHALIEQQHVCAQISALESFETMELPPRGAMQ